MQKTKEKTKGKEKEKGKRKSSGWRWVEGVALHCALFMFQPLPSSSSSSPL
jgi:hypothetical protein